MVSPFATDEKRSVECFILLEYSSISLIHFSRWFPSDAERIIDVTFPELRFCRSELTSGRLMAKEFGADRSISESSIETLLSGSSTESFHGFEDVIPIDGGSIFDVV